MLCYLASDLIWASKIKSTADALGLPCRPVRNMDMLEARLTEGGVKALILDLEAPEMAMEMLARVRGAESPEGLGRVRVLAFGPHVEVARLQQARDAGADEIMTRGAFDANLEEVLIALEGRRN